MVITLRDVKVAYIQVNDFKNTNSFLPLQAATLTLEEIERIPEVMAARLQLNNQADSLFQEIGKQICVDYRIEWGSPNSLTDDTAISDEAAKKLRTLLDFIESH